jgi:tagaturonate reductase
LPTEFIDWLENHNTFCSTLVDRIVTGFPRDEHEALETEFGYRDQFVDTAEYCYLFVIQGPDWLAKELCLDQLSEQDAMNIQIVNDIKPYKERKVAILNGAHTALVPVAFLAGIDTVGEALADPQMQGFIERTIRQEIVPTLDLPEDELASFASDVLDRFRNPFIKHQLLSIALNSMTKYRTRILPQLLAYQAEKNTLPKGLTFSLAALIAFYRGKREQGVYELNDDAVWLNRFKANWQGVEENLIPITELVSCVLSDAEHWGSDLTEVPGLAEAVVQDLNSILTNGVRRALSGDA